MHLKMKQECAARKCAEWETNIWFYLELFLKQVTKINEADEILTACHENCFHMQRRL